MSLKSDTLTGKVAAATIPPQWRRLGGAEGLGRPYFLL
jgi:hypothetical protein